MTTPKPSSCGPPPPEALYTDLTALYASIQAFARANGYAFRILDSKPRRKVYACDRAGKYDSRGKKDGVHQSKQRKSASKKCDCKMKVAAKQEGSGWRVTVIESAHNHEASTAPIAHPAHRIAALDPDIRAQILSKAYSGIRNAQILSSLRIEFPQLLITGSDISNIIQTERLQSLAGRTPIQWLLAKLEERGFSPAYLTNSTNNLVHLFYVHPKALTLYQQHPEVLLMDCTYKTNRFRMPLLNICAITGAYSSNLTKLRAYPHAAVKYVENTWLIPWKEKLVQYWVNQHHHFGVLVTSPIEGCHSTLKSYLQRGNGDLNDVFERLLLFWASQQQAIETAKAQEKLRRKHRINTHLFSAVLGQVYDYALEKIVAERAKAPKTTPDATTSPILNPQVVRGKGRPKGALGRGQKSTTNTISSTKRLPSAFELPTSSAPPALEALASRSSA
ncbi:hypothetical protein B7463_g11275, partial [Scytalidium lignicola]